MDALDFLQQRVKLVSKDQVAKTEFDDLDFTFETIKYSVQSKSSSTGHDWSAFRLTFQVSDSSLISFRTHMKHKSANSQGITTCKADTAIGKRKPSQIDTIFTCSFSSLYLNLKQYAK